MRLSGDLKPHESKQYSITGLFQNRVIRCEKTLGREHPPINEGWGLERSDIVKNEPDRFGFRPPSAYQSFYWLQKPVIGTYTQLAHMQENCGVSYEQGGLPFSIAQVEGVINRAEPRIDFPEFFNFRPFGVRPKQQIVNKAFAKLKDQKINIGMTLAFVGETSKMISSRGKDLMNVYLLLRNGELRRAARYLRIRKWKTTELPSLYLEVLFGWSQLYQDLMGAYKELNRESKEKFQLITGRASSQSQRELSVTRPGRLGSIKATGTLKTQTSCRVIGRLYSRGLHRASTLGLLNPAEILWDVVRFSWIIDQFVHVGGYLNAYDATAGLEYLGGSFTEFTSSNGVMDAEIFNPTDEAHTDQGQFITRRAVRSLVGESDVSIAIRNPFQTDVAIAAAVVGTLIVTMRGGGPIPRHYRA